MNDSERHLKNTGLVKVKSRRGVRIFRWLLGIILSLVIVSGLALGGLYLRLQSGPLSFSGLSDRVVLALSDYFDPDWKIMLTDSALELDRGSFALRVRGLEIRNEEGRLQLRAPDTIISVDTLSLLFGRLHPRMIEFLDLQVVGAVNSDGSITLVPEALPGADQAAVPVPPQEMQKVPVPDNSQGETFGAPHGQSGLSQAVEAFLNIVAGMDGPLGVLDRAQFTNLRLMLIDNQQRVRARFNRIDAKFERTSGTGRSFEARLDGTRGNWTLKGEAQPTGNGYQMVFDINDAPVQDLLFLSGLSTLPVTTTLKVSGRADAALSDSILSRFDGSFGTGEGRVDVQDKDATPLFVNSSMLAVSWDEAARRMDIKQLEFRAGETHFRMTGDASMRPGEPWQMHLAADDATLSGVTSDDKPVTVDRFEAELSGNGGVTLDRLLFKGPDLSATIRAAYGIGDDPKAIAVEADVDGTLMRSILRLWPEIVASSPRRYLITSLRGGKAEKGSIKVTLSGEQVKEAMNGGSVPDETLLVDLDVSDGEFLPTAGLPPLSDATVHAKVTGRSAAISGKNAVIAMPDGRSLKVPDIGFTIADFWPDDAVGVISADVEGGADALASFLELPKIREAFSWTVSPKDIKGKANLKLGIDLAINNVPTFADIPISVSGRLDDVTLDKAVGTEKLEKAAFTIDYKNGSLTMKGDGQIAGYPASISVDQPPTSKGIGVVLFSLDDAARARKGLDFGNRFTGVMPVKVTLDLGNKGNLSVYKVEADLTKIMINNLLPGWTKPVGRAGKLSLIATEAGDGIEISDMRLDSGSVAFAGKALLDEDGDFKSADLASFRLSQGDDMQVKVEKNDNVYKAVVRGNLGDARPVIRAFTGGGASRSSSAARSGNAGMNADLDISLNILTGFNGETLTKSVIKAGIRNNSLRQIQLTGRLGSSTVAAQTSTKGNATQLDIQAENAGSFLRYLDIYRRMYGGDIFLELVLGEGAQNGYVMARNFTIRNEPALRRIVPSQTQGTGDRRIDVNDAGFTKARVDFIRNGSRVDFRDGAIWGMQIGFTLDGYMDFGRNNLDVSGTFVPAYGLNNAFAQVPILGTILGGGQYGGLFGVNFRLTGVISSPAVTVNPLSAVAPGIFRKLFGAADPNAPVMPDTPSRR